MRTFVKSCEWPCQREQAFDAIADVESYPDFLPGWSSAQIFRQENGVAYVDQCLCLGGLHCHFVSQAVFHRPESIEITAVQGPFRHFVIRWRFESPPGSDCRIHFRVDYELQPILLEKLVGKILDEISEQVVGNFKRRVDAISAL